LHLVHHSAVRVDTCCLRRSVPPYRALRDPERGMVGLTCGFAGGPGLMQR